VTPFRSTPPPIHTTHLNQKPLASVSACGYTRPVRRSFAALRDRSFRIDLVGPLAPFPGPMAAQVRVISTSLRHSYLCPSALSLCLSTPAPSVSAATTAHCLAGQSLDLGRDFRRYRYRLLLRPLSQTSGFEALRRPSEAPDTTPAPEALPALAMISVMLVTSLSGSTRRDRGCMPGSSEPALFAAAGLGSKSTTQGADFGGPNGEASPYPPTLIVRSSAPSPARLTDKPVSIRAFRG